MSNENQPNQNYFQNLTYNPSFFTTNNTVSLAYATANFLSRIGVAISTATSTTFSNVVNITSGGLNNTGGIITDTINSTSSIFLNGVNINSIFGGLGLANIWTGTNSFNSNLPTSTLTPSLSSQLTTKSYVDSLIPTSLLGLANIWTGSQNTFNNGIVIGSSTSNNTLQLRSGDNQLSGDVGLRLATLAGLAARWDGTTGNAIFYKSGTQMMSYDNSGVAFLDSTSNNNSSIGGSLAVGQGLAIGQSLKVAKSIRCTQLDVSIINAFSSISCINNITSSNNIIANNYIVAGNGIRTNVNGVNVFLTANQINFLTTLTSINTLIIPTIGGIQIQKSCYNTTLYGSTSAPYDLGTQLGNSGGQIVSIPIGWRLDLYQSFISLSLLQSIDNTSGNDILVANTISSGFSQITQILVYYNGILQ